LSPHSVAPSATKNDALPESVIYVHLLVPPYSGEPACFNAEATVGLEGGSVKRMDALSIEAHVKVGKCLADVFNFTHKKADTVNKFSAASLSQAMR
jgi:hypothetical protein